MLATIKNTFFLIVLAGLIVPAFFARAQANFNPHFIISDPELQDWQSWATTDIQSFLDAKGSYLRNYISNDFYGAPKTAAEIISQAAREYQINPKFLLVTLQKEQSLVTDDSPTSKQLDWATGYGVCDGCKLADSTVQRKKGFGTQVDGTAALMRWYYTNKDIKPIIKKKDTPIRIDNQEVTPQSWATAFLYTYTPHLHGNKNFWQIWNTWFSQLYPNGTLLYNKDSAEYWLVQNGVRRKFKNHSTLISRFDPNAAINVSNADLTNYNIGPDISFPNYSVLKTNTAVFLLDEDTLRPFGSPEVVAKLGYNPDELIEVSDSDLAGFSMGSTITASTTAPQGIIYQITDLIDSYYLYKDGILHPIIDKNVVATNYNNLPIEKKKQKDLYKLETANDLKVFKDGTLIKVNETNVIYVIEGGKKRKIADDETFYALGYKKTNVVNVSLPLTLGIPDGQGLFVNSALLSSKNKFLGDLALPVNDLFKTTLPAYLVAEYPSGRIIAGKKVDDVRPIASLTKLLTAYEILNQNVNLKSLTKYTPADNAQDQAKLKLKNGDRLTNQDLLSATLVASINTAAKLLVKSADLSENAMVEQINFRLNQWGADDTRVDEVTGLSENNISTPRNLLKIFIKILNSDTLKNNLSKISVSIKKLSGKTSMAITLKNSNQLMPLVGKKYKILASKTGYTKKAGEVMMMLIESKTTKKQFVIITMGNNDYSNRFNKTNELANWASTQKITVAKSQ